MVANSAAWWDVMTAVKSVAMKAALWADCSAHWKVGLSVDSSAGTRAGPTVAASAVESVGRKAVRRVVLMVED
jgi:hypothetical protein